MSGSGYGPVPVGEGGSYINIGGITVSIPATDDVPFAQAIQNLSLCATILQMASAISDSAVSTAIQSAAAKAFGAESMQLAQRANTPSMTAH